MRLWVKVFIVTLFLVVIATSVSSIITLKQSRQIMIEQKMSDCVVLQERFISNIVHTASLKKSKLNVLLLSSNDLTNIIQAVATDSKEQYFNLAVFSSDEISVYNTGVHFNNSTNHINNILNAEIVFVFFHSKTRSW